MQDCDVFHASCPLIPASIPCFPDFRPLCNPYTSASWSSSTNLFDTNNVFAVLATLVFMIYINHSILTECILWDFFPHCNGVCFINDPVSPRKSEKHVIVKGGRLLTTILLLWEAPDHRILGTLIPRISCFAMFVPWEIESQPYLTGHVT